MMSGVERLLVVSPNWLGDAIMALPAVGDLRRAFPDARLIVAARRAVADLFRMSPAVDEVIAMRWSGRMSAFVDRRVDTRKEDRLAVARRAHATGDGTETGSNGGRLLSREVPAGAATTCRRSRPFSFRRR